MKPDLSGKEAHSNFSVKKEKAKGKIRCPHCQKAIPVILTSQSQVYVDYGEKITA